MKEQRVLFRKGQERKFLDLVVSKLNCISIRGILQFGFEVNYSSLKNYYTERRLLPRGFFESLCHLAKVDSSKLKVRFISGNWGQVKGGRRKKIYIEI